MNYNLRGMFQLFVLEARLISTFPNYPTYSGNKPKQCYTIILHYWLAATYYLPKPLDFLYTTDSTTQKDIVSTTVPA